MKLPSYRTGCYRHQTNVWKAVIFLKKVEDDARCSPMPTPSQWSLGVQSRHHRGPTLHIMGLQFDMINVDDLEENVSFQWWRSRHRCQPFSSDNATTSGLCCTKTPPGPMADIIHNFETPTKSLC
jgi:hypothetical protein